jgi:hypothetical protein
MKPDTDPNEDQALHELKNYAGKKSTTRRATELLQDLSDGMLLGKQLHEEKIKLNRLNPERVGKSFEVTDKLQEGMVQLYGDLHTEIEKVIKVLKEGE